MKVQRALVSVYDTTGVAEFVRELLSLDVEVFATDGTEQYLRDEGVQVRSASELVGDAEPIDPVKGLHPALQAALMSRAGRNGSGVAVKEQDDGAVDLLAVNFQPFERVAARRDSREDDVIDAIDITRPTMLRAAAKNFEHVVVVADPEVYPMVVEELRASDGDMPYQARRLLASRAFDASAHYELAVATWFSEAEDFPTVLLRDYVKVFDLPHGENPHQRAAYYAEIGARRHLLSRVEQFQGPELTFTNMLDLNSARNLLSDFTIPACVIMKHASPAGCAVSGNVAGAFERAFSCNQNSAYGGVIAVNRTIDRETAESVIEHVFEVLFAPNYTEDALEVLTRRPDLTVLVDRERRKRSPGERDMHRVIGGMLVQDTDIDLEERELMDVVGKVQPTELQWGDLQFAWRVAKWVPSNAVVLGRDLTTVGIGGGNPNRYDSVEFALAKAGDRAKGAMLASDSFFPFLDGPELAIKAGVAGIIQPGGSKRDDDIIRLADDAGIPMIFTHRRHFRH